MKLTRDVAETLMSALGRGGLLAEARRLWRSMIWGRASLRPDRGTFLTAVRVFREGGALSQALHAYNGMRRAGALSGETHHLLELVAMMRLHGLEGLGHLDGTAACGGITLPEIWSDIWFKDQKL